MKKSINLFAVFLLLGASVFAAKAPKVKGHNAKMNEQVSFIPLQYKSGFAVMVDKLEPGKSMVIISDRNRDYVFKDVLTKQDKAEKKYVIRDINDGNYTVEVFSKNQDIKVPFSVYTRGGRQMVHMD